MHYTNGNDKDRIIQLNWREGQALVYDAKTVNSLFSFQYHIDLIFHGQIGHYRYLYSTKWHSLKLSYFL